MIFGLKISPSNYMFYQRRRRNTHRMVGQKQVPILQKDDSRYMPESMDIVHYVDKLDGKPLLTGKRSPPLKVAAQGQWLRQQTAVAASFKSAFDEFSTPCRANISSTRKRPARVILLTCWPLSLIKNISDDLRALDKRSSNRTP
ncbi:glutathione S-transferase N-terminal domain-containing protein [Escherichia coli]|nr:glutathione S-transferase N-terminal domain-containing protein [Escherichia coli]